MPQLGDRWISLDVADLGSWPGSKLTSLFLRFLNFAHQVFQVKDVLPVYNAKGLWHLEP